MNNYIIYYYMDNLSNQLKDIVKEGIEYNSNKLFPTNDDINYVIKFIEKLTKSESIYMSGLNAINHYLNEENITLPIELYSKNVKQDSINIGKYLSKKYKNVLVKSFDENYKIYWEGKYQNVVILNYFNLNNKNKKFIDLKYLLMRIFYEFNLPREYFNNWKNNLNLIDKLLSVSKLNIKNRKLKNNTYCNQVKELLNKEKNFFYSGMEYLKYNKLIKDIEYLDIYALEPKDILKIIKKKFKKVKIEKQKQILEFIPEADIIKIEGILTVKIYPIKKCYSHTGYYGNIFNVLLILINFEPELYKIGINYFNKLDSKFKYQGDCIGPLPMPIDKISSKLIFSNKKNKT